MSDTIRNVTEHPRWHPGFPEFDKLWGKGGTHSKRCYTVKHQTRDRQSLGSLRKKTKKFIKGVRNDRHSLLKKVEALQLQENLEE